MQNVATILLNILKSITLTFFVKKNHFLLAFNYELKVVNSPSIMLDTSHLFRGGVLLVINNSIV